MRMNSMNGIENFDYEKRKKEYEELKKKEREKKKKLLAGAAAGAGIYGASKSGDLILGKKNLYHGTTQNAWRNIKKDGIRPEFGGSLGSGGVGSISHAQRETEGSKDNIFVTPNKATARMYANLVSDEKGKQEYEDALNSPRFVFGLGALDPNGPEAKMQQMQERAKLKASVPFIPVNKGGKTVHIKMDYDRFKNNMRPDETTRMVIDMDPQYSHMSEKQKDRLTKKNAWRGPVSISPEEIRGSDAKLKQKIEYTKNNLPSYIKNNPARFSAGVGLVAAGAASAALGTHYLYKKHKEKEKEKEKKKEKQDMNKIASMEERLMEKQAMPNLNPYSNPYTRKYKPKHKEVLRDLKNKKKFGEISEKEYRLRKKRENLLNVNRQTRAIAQDRKNRKTDPEARKRLRELNGKAIGNLAAAVAIPIATAIATNKIEDNRIDRTNRLFREAIFGGVAGRYPIHTKDPDVTIYTPNKSDWARNNETFEERMVRQHKERQSSNAYNSFRVGHKYYTIPRMHKNK